MTGFATKVFSFGYALILFCSLEVGTVEFASAQKVLGTVAPKPGKANAPVVHGILAQLETMNSFAAKHVEFAANFRQETFSALRSKTTVSEGRLEFRKPNSFRWEVKNKELFVSNGEDFWKYNPVLRHAQKLPANSADLGFIDLFMRIERLSQHYIAEEWTKPSSGGEPAAAVVSDAPPPSSATKILVKLKPKGASKQKVLFLVVDKNQGIINELRIVFENGNRSRTVFSDFTAKPIDSTRFQFVPPSGTAIDGL